MITVSHDDDVVESQLVSRTLVCPICVGKLRPWGYALPRMIRIHIPAENLVLRPRRARCDSCRVTHVLLPVRFAARRADTASVIGHAIELNTVSGPGHRKIAAIVGRPETTVRGWLRTFRAHASAITVAFASRVHRGTTEALKYWPSHAPTAAGNALGMLYAHAAFLTRTVIPANDGVVVNVSWEEAALAVHGPWMFSRVGWQTIRNTSSP